MEALVRLSWNHTAARHFCILTLFLAQHLLHYEAFERKVIAIIIIVKLFTLLYTSKILKLIFSLGMDFTLIDNNGARGAPHGVIGNTLVYQTHSGDQAAINAVAEASASAVLQQSRAQQISVTITAAVV